MRSLALSSILLASLLPQIHAYSNLDCGSKNRQFVNASLAITVQDPFRTPSGILHNGSNSWTWNLATTSSNMTDWLAGSIEQRLWLDIAPSIDLQSTEIGFLGCGAIFHGLTYQTLVKSQEDDTYCDLVFSPDCSNALAQSTKLAAGVASSLTAPGASNASAFEFCEKLAIEIPPVCRTYFTGTSWVQTFVFASPDTASMCSTTPNDVSSPLAVWGTGTYNRKDLTTYNNLTTLISPFITTMFTNRTSSSSPFFSQQLRCLRTQRISRDSIEPSEVPNDHQAPLSLPSATPTVIPTFKLQSAAKGFTIFMDWLSLLGLCVFLAALLLG